MTITLNSEWHQWLKDNLNTDLHSPVELEIIPLNLDYNFWIDYYNNSPDKKSKSDRSKVSEIPSVSEMQDRMLRSGYTRENIEEWYINDKDEEILQYFGEDNVKKLKLLPQKTTFKIQVYYPSHGLPLHIDYYGSSTGKVHHSERDMLTRYTVQITPWDWGHFLQIGSHVITNYSPGDAVLIPRNVPHLSVNWGVTPRMFITVTGVRSTN